MSTNTLQLLQWQWAHVNGKCPKPLIINQGDYQFYNKNLSLMPGDLALRD
jgi:hypothetical protein